MRQGLAAKSANLDCTLGSMTDGSLEPPGKANQAFLITWRDTTKTNKDQSQEQQKLEDQVIALELTSQSELYIMETLCFLSWIQKD